MPDVVDLVGLAVLVALALRLAVVDKVLDLDEVDEEAHDLRLEHQHHVAHQLLQVDRSQSGGDAVTLEPACKVHVLSK